MARAKTPGNGSTRRKQVATMPTLNSPEPKKNSPPTDLEVEIRRRAYELYVEGGNQSGSELDDWLQAEEEVLQSEQRL